jgi:putative ABC transport system permease protein
MFNMMDKEEDDREHFMNELRKHACVQSVSSGSNYFGTDPGMNSAFFGIPDQNNYFHTSVFYVDHDFFETFGIELIEGRFFQRDRQTDDRALIINEAVLREYSDGDNLVGKEIFLGGNNPYEVIGMVKDFNYRSLHHPLLPLVIRLSENSGNIFVRTKTQQIPETLKVLDKLWAEFNIKRPFEYEFHDEVFAQHYEKDQQAKKLLLILSIISISIACIGLYAISLFIMIRKTKEIGIRKVNGATIGNVLLLLNRDFLAWVMISFLIATPIAWYVMQQWLSNFAYKTELSWWIFALAGMLALGIAFITLSWQSWRIASRNPSEALRYE